MKIYKYAAILLAALLLLVSWFYISSSKKWSKQRGNLSLNEYAMQKKILEIRDSAGREITVYSLEKIQVNDLLQQSTSQVQQLRADLDKAHLKEKNVRSTVQLDVNTQGRVSIGLNDTLQSKTGNDSTAFDSALVNIPFNDSSDKFMRISGNASFQPILAGFIFKGIEFDYKVKDTFTVTHVLTGGFLKKAGVSLMVTSANPHTSIEKVQSYYVVVEKKWFQKWYVQAGAGIVVGFILAHKY